MKYLIISYTKMYDKGLNPFQTKSCIAQGLHRTNHQDVLPTTLRHLFRQPNFLPQAKNEFFFRSRLKFDVNLWVKTYIEDEFGSLFTSFFYCFENYIRIS